VESRCAALPMSRLNRATLLSKEREMDVGT
jgi:hypothetical protein